MNRRRSRLSKTEVSGGVLGVLRMLVVPMLLQEQEAPQETTPPSFPPHLHLLRPHRSPHSLLRPKYHLGRILGGGRGVSFACVSSQACIAMLPHPQRSRWSRPKSRLSP